MRHIVLLSFVIWGCTGFTQQTALSDMYWNNYAHFNPATSGLVWGHELNLTYRDQWSGVNGAPKSFFANYNTIVASKHGAGINYEYDQIGFSRTHKANLNYNYQFKLKNEGKFALGIAAGTNTYTLDPNWVPPTTINDPTLPEASSQTSINFNSGIAYSSRKIMTGIGVTQLAPRSMNGFYTYKPHLHAHFDYTFLLTRKSLLLAGGIAHTDFVNISPLVSVRYSYRRKLWLGIHYRFNESFGANASWDFKNKFRKFRVGYSYGISFNKLSGLTRGTHEIILGMRIY